MENRKEKDMKKVLALVLTLAMVFSLCACGGAPRTVSSTDYMNIDGIYVDNSYKDKDSDALKLLYVCYTVFAKDKNLEVSSKTTKVTIDDANTYDSYRTTDACKYMGNYYYSDYLEDVYIGDGLKVVETFKVPEADLAPGKTITLNNSRIPEIDKIVLATDDIVFCDNAEEVAKAVDPDGYADEVYKREKADEATTKKARKLMNGYYWSFYVNSTSYKVEFSSPNKVTVTAAGNRIPGKYSVRNGYIVITYSTNNYVVEVPFEFVNGDIELDLVSAYDVRSH